MIIMEIYGPLAEDEMTRAFSWYKPRLEHRTKLCNIYLFFQIGFDSLSQPK